jgi:dTDP-4-amino-4,6-dideoxygalactose transaminase
MMTRQDPPGVPLLDLQGQYAPLRESILAAITRVCDSQRFILGPDISAFEEEIASLIGVRHAVGVSSGTDALLLALMVLGVGLGDEVVTSTYSFFATAGAVVRVGARPVFVDIDPVTYNLDPDHLSAAISRRRNSSPIEPSDAYGGAL